MAWEGGASDGGPKKSFGALKVGREGRLKTFTIGNEGYAMPRSRISR